MSRYITSAANSPVSGYTSFVTEVRQIVGEKAKSAAVMNADAEFFVMLRVAKYSVTAAAAEKNADNRFRFLIGSPGRCAKK